MNTGNSERYMASEYQPMLAKTVHAPFNSDEWFFEIKWDGIRAIASVHETVSLKSRNNHELIGQFPELNELLHLAPGTVLDGEIVVMSGGKPDIQSLLPRLHQGSGKIPTSQTRVPVTYIVFDILKKDTAPLISLPLVERREILKQSVQEGPHVILSVPVTGRGEDYYHAAVARGLEGIMAKRMNGRYEPGLRSENWLKIKADRTCDCVIAGYTPGQGGRSPAFGALVLGLYENRSRDPAPITGRSRGTGLRETGLVYIGNVGSGFTDQDLHDLMSTFSSLKTDIPHFLGQKDTVVWLKPVLVAEVAYQEVTRDKKLRIPRFIRLRAEKRAEECTMDQLEPVKADFVKSDVVPAGEPATIAQRSGEREVLEKPVPARPSESSPARALRDYQKKRDFLKTQEPEGTTIMTGNGNYFVIHEHHARHTHFDLRLERDGVLKSWAVPKGIPEVPGEKHLAVAVEDHPLDYGHFEGTIPAGEYGAGSVSIWDNGTYDTKLWENDKIEITFHGKKLTGHYVLVTFKRAGKSEWLVFKTAV
jgi:DNA ligase D-like protein (predicted ligase)/DNA ligase D-like protein (predicted 3'-phosphoesterase)